MGVKHFGRIGVWKASQRYFLGHNGKVIAFRDVRQLTSFKKRFPNLYRGMRAPDSALYSRGIQESDKTIRYEDIPVLELKEREEYWHMYFVKTNCASIGVGKGPDGSEVEPYGPSYGISLK